MTAENTARQPKGVPVGVGRPAPRVSGRTLAFEGGL